jgi:transcriptional regulator with XRE-family HTH domain
MDKDLLQIIKHSHPDTMIKLIRVGMALHELTQKELSEKAGINRSLFNMYLNRRVNLTPDEILLVVKALDLEDGVSKLAPILSAPLNFLK